MTNESAKDVESITVSLYSKTTFFAKLNGMSYSFWGGNHVSHTIIAMKLKQNNKEQQKNREKNNTMLINVLVPSPPRNRSHQVCS